MEGGVIINIQDVIKVAEELFYAEVNAKPIEISITKRFKDISLEDAYAIQLELIKKREEAGQKIIGKKIGFTSEKLRNQFNVVEPDYGILMDNIVLMENEFVKMSELIYPKVEAEIAFILKKDLEGPNVTIADVYSATEGIIPCFEIVDSRMKNWDMKLLDSIADNASNARVILGSQMKKLEDFDLKHIGLVVSKNGRVVETAAGAAVFGHPANSVAWLANKLSTFGITLKKGEIILSGSFTPVFDVKAGDCIQAVFDKLGSVTTIIED